MEYWWFPNFILFFLNNFLMKNVICIYLKFLSFEIKEDIKTIKTFIQKLFIKKIFEKNRLYLGKL